MDAVAASEALHDTLRTERTFAFQVRLRSWLDCTSRTTGLSTIVDRVLWSARIIHHWLLARALQHLMTPSVSALEVCVPVQVSRQRLS